MQKAVSTESAFCISFSHGLLGFMSGFTDFNDSKSKRIAQTRSPELLTDEWCVVEPLPRECPAEVKHHNPSQHAGQK